MFAQVHTPLELEKDRLDHYLKEGWFRMGQNIFTTNFLNFKGQFYSALWLRVDISRYQGNGTQQKLARLNSRFRQVIRKAVMNAEKEELFARYRNYVTFEASSSIHQLLYGKAVLNIYDTYEVCLYHEEKLIGCGFFDLGLKSAAGISSFYDPEYKKYSIGRYLIYQKIGFCQQKGMRYFYPGYFVPGYKYFDYKLTIGSDALEYLDYVSDQWRSISAFEPAAIPLQIMKRRLSLLSEALTLSGIGNELLKYEFFEANLLPELKDVGLLDHPVFLYAGQLNADSRIEVIVFDIRSGHFRIIRCYSLWNSNLPDHNGMFSSQLLKEDETIFESASIDHVVSYITHEAKRVITK